MGFRTAGMLVIGRFEDSLKKCLLLRKSVRCLRSKNRFQVEERRSFTAPVNKRISASLTRLVNMTMKPSVQANTFAWLH